MTLPEMVADFLAKVRPEDGEDEQSRFRQFVRRNDLVGLYEKPVGSLHIRAHDANPRFLSCVAELLVYEKLALLTFPRPKRVGVVEVQSIDPLGLVVHNLYQQGWNTWVGRLQIGMPHGLLDGLGGGFLSLPPGEVELIQDLLRLMRP